jgi:hypothetical protein
MKFDIDKLYDSGRKDPRELIVTAGDCARLHSHPLRVQLPAPLYNAHCACLDTCYVYDTQRFLLQQQTCSGIQHISNDGGCIY